LSPIFVVEVSHGGIVFSAGAGVKADMQTCREPDADPDAEPDAKPGAEPDAKPDAEPGAEPDVAVCMTGVPTVGVGRLVASLVEEWGAG
jgi:hypothetical protein